METVAVKRVPRTAPPLALLKVTRKVFVPSTNPSFRIGTIIVRLVCPGPKASVPETAGILRPTFRSSIQRGIIHAHRQVGVAGSLNDQWYCAGTFRHGIAARRELERRWKG